MIIFQHVQVKLGRPLSCGCHEITVLFMLLDISLGFS